MATRYDQQAMYDLLQDIAWKTKRPNSRNAWARTNPTLAPMVGPAELAMLGGIPPLSRGKLPPKNPDNYIGALAPSQSPSRRAAYNKAEYNRMRREEAKAARQTADPFSPGTYLNQGGGAAPGGYGPSLQELLAMSYLDQINQANAANKQRYGQLLDTQLNLYDRNMERINTLGEQQAADIRRDYTTAQGDATAALAGRGLSGSTVAPAVQARFQREQGDTLNRLQDQLTRQRIDADVGLTSGLQGFIERRNDVAPDLGQLIGLSQNLGLGGYAGGGNMFYPNYPMPQQNTSRQRNFPYAAYGGGGGSPVAMASRASGSAAYPSVGGTTTPAATTPRSTPGLGNDMLTAPNDPSRNWYDRMMQMYSQQGGFGQQAPGGYGSSIYAGNDAVNMGRAPHLFGGGFGYQGPQPPNALYGGGGPQGNLSYGGKAHRSTASMPIDYAAAEAYQRSVQPRQQQQPRYVPTGGGGGGYGRPIPAPQFLSGYSVPQAAYAPYSGYPTGAMYSGNYGNLGGVIGNTRQQQRTPPMRPGTNENDFLLRFGPYFA